MSEIAVKYNWVTTGHHLAKKLLERFLVSGQVPHAILLWGEAGIGKLALAQEFAVKLLGVSALSQSLDYIYHDLAEQGTVEEARSLLSHMSGAPYAGQYRVVLINHFDQASPAVANLFLKTLEEPSSHTIILLVADSRDILPTALSRVQQIALHGASVAISERFPAEQEWVEKLTNSLSAPLADRALLLAELAELETETLTRVLRAWLYWNSDMLRSKPALWPQVSNALSVYRDFAAMPGLNKKLVLGRLLL